MFGHLVKGWKSLPLHPSMVYMNSMYFLFPCAMSLTQLNILFSLIPYLGFSISYQFSYDVEFKLVKFLQLICTIKKTIFRKARTETILKIYNTLILPTFLYGSENWNLTALERRRVEAAEMKLLRPLAGYTVYDHKTNDSVRRELQTECILDQIDEQRRNWLLHLQRMPLNRITLKSYHYRPQGRRTIGRPKKRWRVQL